MNKPSEATMRGCAANLLAFVLDAALDQNIVGPVILSDEYLEDWGRFYEENNFYARGILFETFLTDPEAISQAVLFGGVMPLPRGEEYYPLLPRQREVALRTHPRVRANSRPLPGSHDALVRAGFTPTLPGVSVTAELPVFLRKQAD